MPRFVVFDSSYDVREYIGFIDASSEQSARLELVDIVKYLRLRRLINRDEPWRYNDDILELIARWYVYEYLELEEMKHSEEFYIDGFNWLGNLRECLPR